VQGIEKADKTVLILGLDTLGKSALHRPGGVDKARSSRGNGLDLIQLMLSLFAFPGLVPFQS
jgi:hypothetical protein